MNDGRFKPGEVRKFIKTCDTCGERFESRSGNRKRCPGCCKCAWCGTQMPNATDRFCGNSCAGKWKYKNSPKVREAIEAGRAHPNRGKGISRYRKGRPRLDMRGENNPNWQGGTTRYARQTAMGRIEYIEWRREVFERDDYTCQNCGERGGKLNAHHSEMWKDCPGFRYHLENGVTLCVDCHKDRHRKAA